MNYFYISINFTLTIVCFVMGLFFLFYKNFNYKTNKSYKFSLTILAVAYLILGLLNLLALIFNIEDYKPRLIPFSIILASSFQALLFTFTLIILFNPKFATRKKLIINIIPISVFLFSYIIFSFFYSDFSLLKFEDIINNIHNPLVIIRICFFVFYCVQLFFYTFLFLKEEKNI